MIRPLLPKRSRILNELTKGGEIMGMMAIMSISRLNGTLTLVTV